MSIEIEQIQKIAKLAKLKIEHQSIDEISTQLDTIMSLIDQLEQANTDGVEPLSHPQDPTLRLRDDVISEPDQRDAFMALTPHSDQGFYLVPKVIE